MNICQNRQKAVIVGADDSRAGFAMAMHGKSHGNGDFALMFFVSIFSKLHDILDLSKR
jgi:hypothetical protein